LRLKINFVRNLSQCMAFYKVEGGEEMSRERGIFFWAGFKCSVASFLHKEIRQAVCLLIAPRETVCLFKAD